MRALAGDKFDRGGGGQCFFIFLGVKKKKTPVKISEIFSVLHVKKKVHVKKSKIASKSARENLVLPVKKIPKRHT